VPPLGRVVGQHEVVHAQHRRQHVLPLVTRQYQRVLQVHRAAFVEAIDPVAGDGGLQGQLALGQQFAEAVVAGRQVEPPVVLGGRGCREQECDSGNAAGEWVHAMTRTRTARTHAFCGPFAGASMPRTAFGAAQRRRVFAASARYSSRTRRRIARSESNDSGSSGPNEKRKNDA
jgi:hypothetical protein